MNVLGTIRLFFFRNNARGEKVSSVICYRGVRHGHKRRDMRAEKENLDLTLALSSYLQDVVAIALCLCSGVDQDHSNPNSPRLAGPHESPSLSWNVKFCNQMGFPTDALHQRIPHLT
jgi:hypothetical protein